MNSHFSYMKSNNDVTTLDMIKDSESIYNPKLSVKYSVSAKFKIFFDIGFSPLEKNM